MENLLSEILPIIKAVLQETGDISNACVAAEISLTRFHSYYHGNNTFKKIVDEAKDFYKNSITASWDVAAINFTDSLLKGRVTKTTVTRTFYRPSTPRNHEDDDFDMSEVDLDQPLVEMMRVERSQTVSPPQWLLQRYLPTIETEAIEVNVNFNAIPETINDESDPYEGTLEG